MRTQEQILARFDAAEDFFGWARETLAYGMERETLESRGFAAGEEWKPSAHADIERQAKEYLAFAIGKIEDHRGISAERSVYKLTEFAWLLGRDDVVAAMDAAEYPQYGAPKVKAFAAGMGWPYQGDEQAWLDRMADGKPCEPDCGSGCGQ